MLMGDGILFQAIMNNEPNLAIYVKTLKFCMLFDWWDNCMLSPKETFMNVHNDLATSILVTDSFICKNKHSKKKAGWNIMSQFAFKITSYNDMKWHEKIIPWIQVSD